MKNKMIAYGMLCLLLIGTLEGCGRKKTNVITEKESYEEAGNSLAALREAEQWTDTWSFVDAKGKEQTVSIDAKIVVPDMESMLVVEVESAGVDGGFREQLLKTFFENGEIYYHDEAHYTKEELSEYIAALEDLQDFYNRTNQYTDGEVLELMNRLRRFMPLTDIHTMSSAELESAIEECEGLLEEAPENYTVADSFEDCDNYIGYREDVLYRAKVSGAYVEITATDPKAGGPEGLADNLYVSALGEEIKTQDTVSNECRYSMEEAEKLAESFLNEIGRSQQICTATKQLVWTGSNGDEESESVNYGYEITFGTGVDGVAFSQFPNFIDFSNTDKNMDDAGYYNGDSTIIRITDDGITEVYMQDPVVIRTVSNEVELLPLDPIKDILKNEVVNNNENYDLGIGAKFNELQLIYLKLKDASEEGISSYVPVWCLSHCYEDMNYHENPVLVNAIDGSVIAIEDVSEP